MAKRKKSTFKQIKRAAAKKAGRTKHELSELNRRIATQNLFDEGKNVMEIAVAQRRRLSSVIADLRQNEKNQNAWHGTHHSHIPSGEAVNAVINSILKQNGIEITKDIGNRILEGIMTVFERTAATSRLPLRTGGLGGRTGRGAQFRE